MLTPGNIFRDNRIATGGDAEVFALECSSTGPVFKGYGERFGGCEFCGTVNEGDSFTGPYLRSQQHTRLQSPERSYLRERNQKSRIKKDYAKMTNNFFHKLGSDPGYVHRVLL